MQLLKLFITYSTKSESQSTLLQPGLTGKINISSAFKLLSTHQAVYESHAESVGSLVQFHYKHHTQVIRKGRGARGGYRERKFTPTNTPCRGHGHQNTQRHTHTHTKGLAMGLDKCAKDTQILRHMQQCSYRANLTHRHVLLTRACRCHTQYRDGSSRRDGAVM